VFLDVEVDLSVISGIANTFSLDNKISMDANAKVRPHHSRWDRHFKMVALESRAKDRDVLNVRYPLQKVAFSPVEPSVKPKARFECQIILVRDKLNFVDRL